MVSRRHQDLRLIEPAVFLQRLDSVDRVQLAGVLNSSLVHWVILFRANDGERHVFLEIGPGCPDKTIDDGLIQCPSGFSPCALVPSRSCPLDHAEFMDNGVHPVVFNWGKLVSIRELVPGAKQVAAKDAMSDSTDTLRRALHSALTAITDREVSLSVREGGAFDQQRHFTDRERDLDELSRRIAARDAELKVLRRALDLRERDLLTREKSLAELDAELKTRKNSVYFREKSLAARQSEMDSQVLNMNAREGSLVTAEKSMAVREKMIASQERRMNETAAAFAAEKIRLDAELRAVQAELAAREDLVCAREKVLASRELTIKAETIAMLQALESITNASRTSGGTR